MHLGQLREIERSGDRFEIELLSAGKTLRPARFGQGVDGAQNRLRMAGIVRDRGHHFKGEGLQCIAGQNGSGLVKGPVAAWFAAPLIIVIHGRKIVMDQRIGMNQFDGCGRIIEQGRWQIKQVPGGINQLRPVAFAPAQYGIAQRLVERPGWTLGVRQKTIQNRFDVGRKTPRSVHDPSGGCPSSHGTIWPDSRKRTSIF